MHPYIPSQLTVILYLESLVSASHPSPSISLTFLNLSPHHMILKQYILFHLLIPHIFNRRAHISITVLCWVGLLLGFLLVHYI